MGVAEGSFVAGLVVGGALAWLVTAVLRGDRGASEHAWMLGRRARARKYECYPWKDGTIVCVSWKGGVRFRADDGEGFWIDKGRTASNLVIDGRPA